MTSKILQRSGRPAAALMVVVSLGGCNIFDRLSDMGRGPQLSPIENPTKAPGYTPVSMPMPRPQVPEDNPNSLWRAGARAFFKDIRAKEVGDILTVRLSLADKAKFENKSTRGRNDGEQMDLNTMVGYESRLSKIFPKEVNNGGELFSFSTKHDTEGNGKIDRKETMILTFAAVVTQVLPNGSLAIIGRQEVKVNYELRELRVTGVVRPQDIEADNSISHEKIAEMRVAYGGRGMLSDLQEPRWGTQLWDILFPF